MTDAERKRAIAEGWRANAAARAILKPGDRVRGLFRCGQARASSHVFDSWDGYWIVTKGGRADLSPCSITHVNDKPVDFAMLGNFAAAILLADLNRAVDQHQLGHVRPFDWLRADMAADGARGLRAMQLTLRALVEEIRA